MSKAAGGRVSASRSDMKARMYRGATNARARRAMERAETPYSDAELIEMALSAGNVKRLPAGLAEGASRGSSMGDWR